MTVYNTPSHHPLMPFLPSLRMTGKNDQRQGLRQLSRLLYRSTQMFPTRMSGGAMGSGG